MPISVPISPKRTETQSHRYQPRPGVSPTVRVNVLLGAAVWLAVSASQYPFVHGWLTAKVLALLVYIGLGFAAFRLVEDKRKRLMCWAAALMVFGYMAAVARAKHPWPVAVFAGT